VLLFDAATSGGTTTFGRYYFDEIRELSGKRIVGFNVDLGLHQVTSPCNISAKDNTGTVHGQPYQNAYVFDVPNFFLNIYNDQKELILENFPCLLAANYNLNSGINSGGGKKPGTKYIFPLDTKINIRESYIFGNANLILDNVVISVNFYYI